MSRGPAFSLAAAAEYCGCTSKGASAARWARRRVLPYIAAVHIPGGRLVVMRADLDEYLIRHRQPAPDPGPPEASAGEELDRLLGPGRRKRSASSSPKAKESARTRLLPDHAPRRGRQAG